MKVFAILTIIVVVLVGAIIDTGLNRVIDAIPSRKKDKEEQN